MIARRREKGQCRKRHSPCVPQGGRNEWVSSNEGKLEKLLPHIPNHRRKKAEISVVAGALTQHVNFASIRAAGREAPLEETETGGTRACLRSTAPPLQPHALVLEGLSPTASAYLPRVLEEGGWAS